MSGRRVGVLGRSSESRGFVGLISIPFFVRRNRMGVLVERCSVDAAQKLAPFLMIELQ